MPFPILYNFNSIIIAFDGKGFDVLQIYEANKKINEYNFLLHYDYYKEKRVSTFEDRSLLFFERFPTYKPKKLVKILTSFRFLVNFRLFP